MRTTISVILVFLVLCIFSDSNYSADKQSDFDKLSQYELDVLLQNAINRKEGKYLDKYVIEVEWLDGKTTYRIVGADEDCLHLKKGKNTLYLKWTKVKPWIICELYWLIHERTAGIYWAMAEFAYDNQLVIQGSEFLAEMSRRWKTLRYKAEKYMAKKLEVPLPDKGYRIYAMGQQRSRLVTEQQIEGIENADKIAKKIKEFTKSLKAFSKSKVGEKRDTLFEELKGTIKKIHELYADAERFEMVKILVEGFRDAVKRLRDVVDEKTKERQAQLDQARDKALRRIFDTVKYPDNPSVTPEDGGQDWVNEAVNDVKSIWTNPELGRIESQIKIFGEKFFDLYKSIEKDQIYVKDFEFYQQMNIIAVDKIDKTVFPTKGLDETAEELEARLYQDVNAYRAMFGYEPLKIEKKVGIIAKAHALKMKQLNLVASKISGSEYGETLTERLEKVSYKSGLATDLLSDKGDPVEILRDWQKNAAYHRSLLTKTYTKYGTGFVEKYCCMVLTEK